ncbi:hypothetical protein WR25_08607 [Diploscapter pachys]|uniref:Translation elongation factor EFTu/EF1A C-terminal domain-containing protein n=1 Tax=Diploscapter pachys TaxID=2018661 RepID=A0A2A2M5P7_9BILA|nr:hypothetical protein WR25_08607 [Diploscapter pachys]
MVMPGDNIALGIKLIAPIAMDVGQRFTIREGGRTVGAGVWDLIPPVQHLRHESSASPRWRRPGSCSSHR